MKKPSVWLGAVQRVSRKDASRTQVSSLMGRFDALAIADETNTEAVVEFEAEVESVEHQIPAQPAAQTDTNIPDNVAGSSIDEDWTTIRQRHQSRPVATSVAASKRVVEAFDVRKVDDWRKRDPEIAKARELQAMTLRTAITRNTRKTCRTGGGFRNRRGESLANQVPGAVVWHQETRRNKNPNILDNDPRVSWKNGKRYVTKGRYWLIVEVTGEDVYECPIFTNNDRGLESVDRRLWSQYMSLVPKGRDPETFKNQSPDNDLVLMDWMDPDQSRQIRDTAVIHLAGVERRPIDRAEMNVVGTIAKDQVEEVSRKALKASGL